MLMIVGGKLKLPQVVDGAELRAVVGVKQLGVVGVGDKDDGVFIAVSARYDDIQIK